MIAAAALSLLTACSGSDSASTTPSTGSGSASSTSSGSPSADGDDIIKNPPTKSWQDALDVANKEFTGKVSKIELEPREQDGLEYKVELMSPDTKYAVQYDADSLKKISEKQDDLVDDAAKDLKETFDRQA